MTDTGVRVFPAGSDQRGIPSVVLIDDSGILVGDEAKHSAVLYPDRTFAFFKRDMGVAETARTVDGQPWSPTQLSAEVLRALVGHVQRHDGELPGQCVITVPAYFGDAARRATIEAGERAGLEVLELIHEPTAAALAFGFERASAGARTVLVYDLGGGTFDVSLVRIGDGEMEVIATDGDHELGGKDWDDVLIGIVADRFNERHGIDPRWDSGATADLRERCEGAKRSLSKMPQTSIAVVADGVSDRIPVTRTDFEEMTAALLGRTETLLQQVLADASVDWDAIAATVLVGGSTRMPACGELIARVSGRAGTRGIDPDTAVVHGAAMVAARARAGIAIATENRDAAVRQQLPKLKDITAHALGFVVINDAGDRYVNEVMIRRNAALPSLVTKLKRLEQGIEELDIYVLQGHQERPLATESLGRFRFRAVPGAERHRDVEITFMYDSDGIVRVQATACGQTLGAPDHNPADCDLSWTDEDPRDLAHSLLDAALLIDCSGSMSGRRIDEAKESCADFARLVGDLPGARVGLVSFASGARIEAPLSEAPGPVVAAARRLSVYGGTDLSAGLEAAPKLFDRDDGRRVIVVVTDGEPNSTDSARAAAAACHAAGIEIVTVGVSGADMAFLGSISTADKDSIFTDDMKGTLRAIARSLTGALARRA
jgi:molecular chaperone DnaK (HSP70)